MGSDNKESNEERIRKRLSNSTATASSIDPNLLSAIIAAVVAFIILLLDKLLIEPTRWRKRYEIKWLEKQIQVHEWLLTILKACREKAKRQVEKRTNPPPHLLESADIWKLEDIFEKNGYLLADELKNYWYAFQRRDEYFELARVRNRDVDTPQSLPTELGTMTFPSRRHEVIADDLTKMEAKAESDSATLRSRYSKLMTFNLWIWLKTLFGK